MRKARSDPLWLHPAALTLRESRSNPFHLPLPPPLLLPPPPPSTPVAPTGDAVPTRPLRRAAGRVSRGDRKLHRRRVGGHRTRQDHHEGLLADDQTLLQGEAGGQEGPAGASPSDMRVRKLLINFRELSFRP